MRQLTQDDILDLGDYAASRADRRGKIIALKARRRVALGPHAMFMFENWDTMWHQVHEMLYIEQGVPMGRPIDPKSVSAQLRDELAAYNPLIPNGAELVATVMFEIENPDRRDTVLDNLGGVEHSFSLKVGDQDIAGVPETDTERTNEAGRASSVQFLHFPFTADQRDLFRAHEAEITLVCAHPGYAHMAGLNDELRAELARDFD